MVPDVLVLLAKTPVPGRVKTRLQPTFSAEESAALAAAAIRDTLDAMLHLRPRRTVVVWDGPAVPWLPASVSVIPQRGRHLDERLELAFEDVYATQGMRETTVLLVGMDTPQLRAADLDLYWAANCPAVLGLSTDGGYWAVGFRRHVPGAFRGIPMSTPRTGAEQLDRFRSLRLQVGQLPVMNDVDDADDAAEIARLAPETRFGRLYRRLVASAGSPTTMPDAAPDDEAVEIWLAVDSAEPTGFLGADPSTPRRGPA